MIGSDRRRNQSGKQHPSEATVGVTAEGRALFPNKDPQTCWALWQVKGLLFRQFIKNQLHNVARSEITIQSLRHVHVYTFIWVLRDNTDKIHWSYTSLYLVRTGCHMFIFFVFSVFSNGIMLGRWRCLSETPTGNSSLAHGTNKCAVFALSVGERESTCTLISTVRVPGSSPCTVFTPALPLPLCWGLVPTPNPGRDNTCNFGSLWPSITGFFCSQRRSSDHFAFCEITQFSKEISQWGA